MELGEPDRKKMTLYDLARLVFDTDPGLLDIIWNDISKRWVALS